MCLLVLGVAHWHNKVELNLRDIGGIYQRRIDIDNFWWDVSKAAETIRAILELPLKGNILEKLTFFLRAGSWFFFEEFSKLVVYWMNHE